MMSFLLAGFVALLPLYLVRFSIPFPGLGGGLPTTALEVLFWAVFVTWLFTDGAKPGAWRGAGRWVMPAVLLMVAATVGVLVSPDTRAALGLWRAYFLEPLLCFAMACDVLQKPLARERVLGALGLLCALVGVTAIFQKLTGFGIPNPLWAAAETRRVTGVFGFPNAIGLLCAPIVTLMTAWGIDLWSRRERLRALLPWLSAALGAAGIAFAVSEGAMIGAAAGIGALLLFHRRLRAIALLGIIAGCAAVLFYGPVRGYVHGIATFNDDSSSVRMLIWRETAAMLRDAPVFGAGLSGYPLRIDPYHKARHIEIFQYPHQFVMNWWSETGLLGLLAITWVLWRFFALCWRAKDEGWIAGALAAAMLAVLVHGLVDVPYFKNDLAMQFWLLVAMLESVRQVAIARESTV